jgi:hypothetical protein
MLEKSSNIKIHKNPSSGRRAVPRGRTDRRDEANSRFSQFCERAQKLHDKVIIHVFTAEVTNIQVVLDVTPYRLFSGY